MKISEAMRKGAKLGPQLFNEGDDGQGGSCAFWAIRLGGGVELMDRAANTSCKCPIDNCNLPYTNGSIGGIPRHMFRAPESLADVIVHLNNDHRWTRERIAGWIEAHIEVPTYSLLEIMEFMGEPIEEPVHVK